MEEPKFAGVDRRNLRPPYPPRMTALLCVASTIRGYSSEIGLGECRLAITGEFDEVPVRITDVHRAHQTFRSCLIKRSDFDLDTMDRKFTNNVIDRSIAYETNVASPRCWDVCVREILRTERMQVDFLFTKMKSIELPFKYDVPHSQHSLIKLDSRRHVAYG
jgi:hypothetical protein